MQKENNRRCLWRKTRCFFWVRVQWALPWASWIQQSNRKVVRSQSYLSGAVSLWQFFSAWPRSSSPRTAPVDHTHMCNRMIPSLTVFTVWIFRQVYLDALPESAQRNFLCRGCASKVCQRLLQGRILPEQAQLSCAWKLQSAFELCLPSRRVASHTCSNKKDKNNVSCRQLNYPNLITVSNK